LSAHLCRSRQERVLSHGFSSAKFLPGRPDTLVALKSEEVDGATATCALSGSLHLFVLLTGGVARADVMVFTTEGRVLLPETKIADMKLEGVEVLA
jgi:soluble calcium-activated nucleotidase 1